MEGIEKVCAFLEKTKTYYLATVDGDQARVRPFGTAHIFEDRLYFQTGLKKDVAKQMLANPKVEISAMVKGDWIRLSGEAVLDERLEAQRSLLDAYPSLRKMYAVGDGNTAVFYLKNAKAVFCSFTKAPEEVTF